MNLPFCLWTAAVDTAGEPTPGAAGNRFVTGGYSRDLRNARITLRLRGVGFDGKGAALKLLVQ